MTNGTRQNQEMAVLRKHIESNNKEKNTAQKHLWGVDKAVIDFSWWDRQAAYRNYMIFMLKEKSIATFVEAITFDERDKINTSSLVAQLVPKPH